MSPFEDAYAYATSYCSTAERCAKELLVKLVKYELDDTTTQRLLERLRTEGFLNEERYTRAFVNDAFRFNKWGRLKIRQGLKMKGLPERLINQALNDLDQSAYEATLVSLLQQKRRQVPQKKGQPLKEHLYRFAITRGFESNLVLRCLKQLMPGTDGDMEDESYLD